MSYLVSICITSYKRLKELRRCLDSIDASMPERIEVIVSDDCSPVREQTRQVVADYAATSQYHVVFNTNEQNLGFDRNLKKLATLAHGDYILYMSDDDVFFPHKLDLFMQSLEEQKPALAYSSFWQGQPPKHEERRTYPSSHHIASGEKETAARVYDAILFSGLAFRRELIKDIDAERFRNLNYFQVYMFMTVMYNYGGYYDKTLLVNSMSDGESAYGQVESSKDDTRSLDRNSVFANITYNKGLFEVIKMFDQEHGTHIFQEFSKEYSLRSFVGFCEAREDGLRSFRHYWHLLKTSGIKLSAIPYIYYVTIGLLGTKASKVLYDIPKKVLLLIRRHN